MNEFSWHSNVGMGGGKYYYCWIIINSSICVKLVKLLSLQLSRKEILHAIFLPPPSYFTAKTRDNSLRLNCMQIAFIYFPFIHMWRCHRIELFKYFILPSAGGKSVEFVNIFSHFKYGWIFCAWFLHLSFTSTTHIFFVQALKDMFLHYIWDMLWGVVYCWIFSCCLFKFAVKISFLNFKHFELVIFFVVSVLFKFSVPYTQNI